jgi:adenylate cyclase
MFKKIILSPWTALITLALILSVRVIDPSFVESVRLRYFDTLLTQPKEVAAQTNIVTVNIDEASLDKYGQWPLPRGEYAKIIEDLYKRNAGVVVFNVLMPNKDRMGQDAILEKTLSNYPVILPSVPDDKTYNQPRNPGSAVLGPEYMNMIVQYPGLIANIPSLENSAAGVGTVNTLPEIDGVNRRIPLITSIDEKLYPSLAIETLRVIANDTTIQVKLNSNGVEKMRIPKFGPINTDSLGRIWIDWSTEIKSHSLADLPKDFNGAVVIVGLTASGLSNPVPTATGAVFPHDLQASVLATMINGVTIQRPDYADGLEVIAILIAGLLLIFFGNWRRQ